jgi:hypothetical protein
MHCHKISGSFHWELKLNKMEYNGATIVTAPVTVAFLDTGATLSQFPAPIYLQMAEEICKGHNCQALQGVYYIANCDKDLAKFKPLVFTIDNIRYEMPPQSFIYYYRNVQGTPMCEISIRPSGGEKNMFMLGINFLENYLQFYDINAK